MFICSANKLCSTNCTFFNALQNNEIPVEMHIYAKGEYGFLTNPPFAEWFGRCAYWIKSNIIE